jgi:3-oxoacyl-[acyl-carrier-protein] synthase-1/3-oxoacyl-[acyl-carrier-protein] synthase II
LSSFKAFITGAGIVTPAGIGIDINFKALKKNRSFLKPLTLFKPESLYPLPVGEISENIETDPVPRTHSIAYLAAEEALKGHEIPPDAIVLGITTGGMFDTEKKLKQGITDPEQYNYHGTGSVVTYLAKKFKCVGPLITISSTCSSGTAAVKIALELIRCGKAKRVLAGGADSICRLTYYGFNSLQLIDPSGARPFDRDRKGMSVSEGAGFLFIEALEKTPIGAIAEILGGGLSCDAYHTASPHPDGDGAYTAMEKALLDSGIETSSIDYINLHGTGTIDNDRSEAMAIKKLFGDKAPPLSSIKGLIGHSLGAAGAIEAVVCTMAIKEGFIPANTGCDNPDSSLGIVPVSVPQNKNINIVLSNSLGFGGNNASAVFAKPGMFDSAVQSRKIPALRIAGVSCITGAGDLNTSIRKISAGEKVKGIFPDNDLSDKFKPLEIRRMKRLSKITLSIAEEAFKDSGFSTPPDSVFFGTDWGPLSETHDFLDGLFSTREKFPSPTDFIGSVHNSPAGLLAIKYNSKGPCLTTTGNDCSFYQALLSASLLAVNGSKSFLVAAEEFHEQYSAIFDRSAYLDNIHSDGGAAFCLEMSESPGVYIYQTYHQIASNNPDWALTLIRDLGGVDKIRSDYKVIFVGIPAFYKEAGEMQINQFINLTKFKGHIVRYRKLTGEYSAASSVAAAFASRFVRWSSIPGPLLSVDNKQWISGDIDLEGKGILLLGLGGFISAIEIFNKK